jgi:hypothetical protein
MLKSNFPHRVRRLLIAYLAIVALTSHAARQTAEPIDLSILEQRNVLAQSMNASQRVALLKLEADVEEAESDIRSGQYMMQTKPTAFRGQDEVKQIVKQGEETVASATIRLNDAQRVLVTFLSDAQTKRASELAVASKKFNFTVESHPYADAFEASTRTLLETARVNGYKTVFFDEILVVNEDGTQPIALSARNDAYDTLVKIDGTNFTLSLPVGLQLGDDFKLTFDNIEDYGNEKIALLAIELHQKTEGEGLLHMRLIDFKTYQVIHQKLTHTTEVGALLAKEPSPVEAEENAKENSKTDETTAETAEVSRPAAKRLVSVQVNDQGLWIDRLAAQDYHFKIVTEESDSLIPAICLSYTITDLTSMKLIDEDYILRAYGDESTEFETRAGAQLTLTPTESAFNLSARSYNNDRTIEIGSMELIYE